MIDEETFTLWSHLLGTATDGPLEGAELARIPATLTDWESWVESHPQTSVCKMSRSAEHHRRLTGEILQDLCLGFVEDDQSKCWTFPLMSEKPIINDELADRPVLVAFDPKHGTALLFDRRVKDQLLTFEQRGDALVDRETESTWDRLLGLAISGEMEGSRLSQLPAIVSYIGPWEGFHSDGVTVDVDE